MQAPIKTAVHSMTLIAALSAAPVFAAPPAQGTYKIDPQHTSVHFQVNHLGFSEVVGRFNSLSGKINLKPDGDSKVDVEIQTASVDTNYDKRDDHLRSPDFFNAKLYPIIRFTSNKVSFNKNGDPVEVTGELTLHGKTKPVTLSVQPVGAGDDPWGGYRVGYVAKTVIKRSDYGMNFMQGGIGDDIAINLNIEAIKI